MIHSTHFARLLGGYAERSGLVKPKRLSTSATRTLRMTFRKFCFRKMFATAKMPRRLRRKLLTCSGPPVVSEELRVGRCQKHIPIYRPEPRRVWAVTIPLLQRDMRRFNTWTDPMGKPVETCSVCHSEGAEFSVSKVHNIANPYKASFTCAKGVAAMGGVLGYPSLLCAVMLLIGCGGARTPQGTRTQCTSWKTTWHRS